MPTPAACCLKALRDATFRWPTRKRDADGIMGDAAHQTRKSDHNDGNAFDLTHDVAHGVDCNVLSRRVIGDERVTYVIWNRQIYTRAQAASGWQSYQGPNPHTHHMHVSIAATSRDVLSAWSWSPLPVDAVTPTPAYPGSPLKQGSAGVVVRSLQTRLRQRGSTLAADGHFGPATHQAIMSFQGDKGLKAEGIVGPQTWAAIWGG
jgi:hypothetical protein